jgi:hypothetical protein
MNDLPSIRVKEEIITFDEYMSNMQGVHKLHLKDSWVNPKKT